MVEDRVQRKLTTILAADIEGYTRLMRADEEATLKALGEYRITIDALVARHDGRVFSTGGGSALAEFGSAVEAVETGHLSLQDQPSLLNSSSTFCSCFAPDEISFNEPRRRRFTFASPDLPLSIAVRPRALDTSTS